MILFFSDSGNLVGKFHGLGIVLKFEDAVQAQYAILLNGLPLGDVEHQVCNLGISEGWFSAAAGYALSSYKVDHFEPPFSRTFSPQ
jgi:hypothetical protein